MICEVNIGCYTGTVSGYANEWSNSFYVGATLTFAGYIYETAKVYLLHFSL